MVQQSKLTSFLVGWLVRFPRGLLIGLMMEAVSTSETSVNF
jgi:hypothetical protein